VAKTDDETMLALREAEARSIELDLQRLKLENQKAERRLQKAAEGERLELGLESASDGDYADLTDLLGDILAEDEVEMDNVGKALFAGMEENEVRYTLRALAGLEGGDTQALWEAVLAQGRPDSLTEAEEVWLYAAVEGVKVADEERHESAIVRAGKWARGLTR
jgi:hypothetical protein